MNDRDNRGFERERDLILAVGEFAHILDETKGHVSVYVGPTKASLSATDRPVKFSRENRKFVRCVLEEAISTFAFAQKGSYIVLRNPVVSGDEEKKHPIAGSNLSLALAYGSKINIEGPDTFALYPGQYAETIGGHRMRSNQYLIVRVYDEEAAEENWDKATIKLQKSEDPTVEEKEQAIEKSNLTMGSLIVIMGTKVSFYIPPTGIEVVADSDGNYVRNAVTLERLEYCILLDEDGNKRYVQGPDVVFPKPTETFVEKNESRKFRAIELNDLMGIYVKVIADYKNNGDPREYKTGDELFITGKDQKIYYPRPEHAIIKYGKKVRNYALAIPEGEARYVLNRETGEVNLKRGPVMFLPDPRNEVIVKRVLADRDVNLWFPGNREALEYNQNLSQENEGFDAYMMDVRADIRGDRMLNSMSFAGDQQYETAGVAMTEELSRGNSFTPPRSITIDSKYDGAVMIDVWPGYAVQIVSKTGERKVIVGPEVYLLEYDETLEKMSFSKGTPKSDDQLKKDVYLRVKHNTISDMISVETKDLCSVNVVVSFRVNFEGNPKKWFVVENLVKFLTDHLRSVLRNKVKQIGIEEFYGNSIDIIRNTILGERAENNRPGLTLDENGMKVYDLEVLDVEIQNQEISTLLKTSQHESVRQRLEVERIQQQLETTKETEGITQEIDTLKSETKNKKLELSTLEAKSKLELELADLKVESEVEAQRAKNDDLLVDIENSLNRKELEFKDEKDQQLLKISQAKLEQEIKELEADTKSVAAKAEAISPQLIEVLASFANKELAGKLAENFNVLSILGGKNGKKKSVVEMATELFGDTGVGEALKNLQLHGHIGNPIEKIINKVKE